MCRKRRARFLFVSLLSGPLAACSQGGWDPGHPDGGADLSAAGDLAGADLAAGPDLWGPPDQATPADLAGPSADQCLEGWRMFDGRCPGPVIYRSYVGNGCRGTTGWFIEGLNFQVEQHNVGIADYGPQSFGANGNQKHWNDISTTRLCVTVSAGAKSAWVAHTIYVVNPDGKMSNAVVVEDRL